MQCNLSLNSKILYSSNIYSLPLSSSLFLEILKWKILILSYSVCLAYDFLCVSDVSCVFISLLKHLKHAHIEVSVLLSYEVNVTWVKITF